MKEKKAINFSKKYKKLDDDLFHTVRWLDSIYVLGKVYPVYFIADNLFHTHYQKGNVRIYKMEIAKIKNLSEEFCLYDADTDKQGFYNMMEGWYSKKPDWKGWDSEVQILYLMRVDKT